MIGMGKVRSLLMVDLDDTLFFTEESIKKAAKEVLGREKDHRAVRKMAREIKAQIYDLAHSKYINYSRVNPTLAQLLGRSRDTRNVVFTARPTSLHKHTLSLIDTYGLNVHEVISRPDKHLGMKDEEWKLKKLKEMKVLDKYDKIALFDDKIENIRHFREGLKSAKVDYYLVANDAVIEAFNPYKKE
jgi:hypothetical protein